MKDEVEYKGNKYPVKFRHVRAFEFTGHELYQRLNEHLDSCEEITKTDLNDMMELINKKNMLPTGGRTDAYIELEDGTELSGSAVCSEQDVYNKKIGRQISLGRLHKMLDL